MIRVIALALAFLSTSSWGRVRAEDPDPGTMPHPPDWPSLVGGNNRFAFDLYAALRGSGPDNFLFSPVSLRTTLTLAYAGARGETESQMARTLHLDGGQRHIHAATRGLIKELAPRGKAQKGYSFEIATRLWAQRDYDLVPSFLSVMSDCYQVEPGRVDFVHHPEAARSSINEWVATKTRNRIKDLIAPGTVGPDTRLVLTNAIYFKADWRKPFDERNTRDAPFHLSSNETVVVPMMTQKGRFRTAAGGGVEVLELDYTGGEASMMIMMPDKVDGLAHLERSLSAEAVDKWRSHLKEKTIQIYLPRFRMTSKFELGRVLQEMGMRLPFTGKADFSGLSPRHDMVLSQVIHQAFVSVDERGTEAAAGTAAQTLLSLPREFLVDRPFVFLIRDNGTGTITFVGRVMNPLK